MYEPDKVLKDLIRRAGLTTRDIANVLNEPPGTVAGRLNGWLPLVYSKRKAIMAAIERAEDSKKMHESLEDSRGGK